MTKIFSTAALSLAITVALSGHSIAATSFVDLKDSPAKEKIEALEAKGIISGLSELKFGPNDVLTASQGITLITKGMNLSLAAIDFKEGPTANSFFVGMNNNAWYAQSFMIAKANGLDLPANVDPNESITKEVYVHYVMQALEKTGKFPMIKLIPIKIADDEQITADYQGSVQRALHYKLVSLDANSKFNPKSKLTRAEAAEIMYNTVQLYEKQLAAYDNATKDNGTNKSDPNGQTTKP
jgi:hypothetical protein